MAIHIHCEVYRQATAAEWEYAARAGSSGDNSIGEGGVEVTWDDATSSGNLGDYAWYKNNAESTTHPVGTRLPTAFGLYDVHGIVKERTFVVSGYVP